MRLLTLAVIAGMISGPGQQTGRRTVERARRAVEMDSVSAMRSTWLAREVAEPGDWAARLGLATLASLTYQFSEADERYSRIEASSSAPNDIRASAFLGHGASWHTRADYHRAAVLLDSARSLAHAMSDSAMEAEALLALALGRSRLESVAGAESLLALAGPLIPHGEAALQARYLCARASLELQSGKPGALAMADSGLSLARSLGARRAEAGCILVRATFFSSRGDLVEAGKELALAADLLMQTRNYHALAAVRQWRGHLLITVANFGPARRALLEAITLGSRSGNASAVAWARANLAQLALEMNDVRSAGAELARADSMMRKQGDARGEAIVRALQAELALRSGDRDEASRLESIVREWLSTRGTLDDRISAANRRFRRFSMRQEWDSAAAALDSARALLHDAGATGWLGGLAFDEAELALNTDDLAGAKRALATFGQAESMRQPMQRFDVQAMRADLAAREGRLDDAVRELNAASDALDAWRNTAGTPELRRMAFQRNDDFAGPDMSVASVIATLARSGRVRDAFALLERRRSRELTDAMARARSTASVADDMRAPTVRPYTLDDISDAIPDDSTAILEYMVGRDERITVFIVRRDSIESLELGPVDGLAALIARHRALIEAGGIPDSIARKLASAVLTPVLNMLPPRTFKLIIVADGFLYRVPFDALRLENGSYAVEEYRISYLPSASVLPALQQRAAPDGPPRLLSMGAPDNLSRHDGTFAVRAAFGADTLPELPGSGAEARMVARFAPRATVRLGDDASEEYLLSASLDSIAVLHIATHAMVDEQSIAGTALILAPSASADGIVTPGDIAGLRLRASLVVLSSCRTAGGVVLRGEGVQGLTIPFLRAGAHSVAATSWPVNDRMALRFVELFYRKLTDGETVGDAMRIAKMDLLNRGAPPREWAAFRIVGDPAVTIALRPPIPRATIVMAIAIVLGGLVYGGLTVKRRLRDAPSLPGKSTRTLHT